MEEGDETFVLSEWLVIDAWRTGSDGIVSETHVNFRWITGAPFLSLYSLSLSCLFIILPVFSLHIFIIFCTYHFFFLPVPTGCINASSHMLQAESQLSLLSQNDWPGHTSGNPWQEVHCPASSTTHPFIELTGSGPFVGFYTSWKNKANTEPKHWWEVCLSSRSWAEVTHALVQGLFSATMQNSIYNSITDEYNDLSYPLWSFTGGQLHLPKDAQTGGLCHYCFKLSHMPFFAPLLLSSHPPKPICGSPSYWGWIKKLFGKAIHQPAKS